MPKLAQGRLRLMFGDHVKSVLIAVLFFSISTVSGALKEHEEWWQKNLSSAVVHDMFADWLHDHNEPSRVVMRRHVQQKNYKSILVVPCGLRIFMDYAMRTDDLPIY